jgi:hypothetical protein
MKKIILVGSILFSLAIISGCSREPVKQLSLAPKPSVSQSLATTTVVRSREIFINPSGHYSFKYSSEWQAAVNVYNNKNSLFGPGATGESGLGGVEITTYSGTLDEYLNYQEKNVDIKYLTHQKIIINGLTGIRTEYRGSASSGFSVLLKNGQQVLNIYINSHDAGEVKAFDELVASLVILK